MLRNKWSAKRLRGILWRPIKSTTPFATLRRQAELTAIEVRVFYAFYFFITTTKIDGLWQNISSFTLRIPTWPIFWIDKVGDPIKSAKALFVIHFLTIFAAMVCPRSRWARILCFLGTFFVSAVYASDLGGWNRMTTSQIYILITFLFIFLPERMDRVTDAWKSSMIIVLTSMTIFMTYASVALWRLEHAIIAHFNNRSTIYGMEGLGHSGNVGIVGPAFSFFADHHIFGKGLFLVTIFEVLSLFVLWRPRLYRLWGVGLMLLHVCTVLIMRIAWDELHILVALFLVCTPLDTDLFRWPRPAKSKPA